MDELPQRSFKQAQQNLPSFLVTGTTGQHAMLVGMDRDGVMQWVGGYERAWRDGDLGGVERLFTEDARYRPSPYEEAEVGHDAIKDFWLDDADTTFTAQASIVAVDGDTAVVRVDINYGDPVTQEYRDLWLLHFAPDGRVDEFEEWAYWPGKTYSAADVDE